jgi:uncharacterized protein YciI
MTVMLWMIYCEDRADGAAAIRAALRDEHLAYLNVHEKNMVLGGALLADDAVARLGSLFLVNLPNRAAAEALMAEEPFNKAGLFKRVTISRMRKGQFNPSAAPATAEGD